MKILLVEDERELADTLCGLLTRERFTVDHADTLAMAREAAFSGAYDLILLDRTLPDGEGLSLVRPMRSIMPGVAIIVLSARGDIDDRIVGLDGGADDYLAKPFAIEELFARIRAVRRRPVEMGCPAIRIGALEFDPLNDEAEVAGKRVELTRRELRVLSALAKRHGRTVLRETLEAAVFGFDDEIQSNTLDSHVSRLRRKLADAGAGVEIHAVRGVGYLLKAPS